MVKGPDESKEFFDHDRFETLFNLTQFRIASTWTPQGDPRGLSEITHIKLEECVRQSPELGVVEFKKLKDGGYEITSYTSLSGVKPDHEKLKALLEGASTQWTGRNASLDELSKTAHGALEKCLKATPELGILQFRKLDDKGYEIISKPFY
ncbi:MAG: hypothetical protein ACD_28C00303G0005 [uncultured bacterium]|nr:MAG: hypothetical protein ACD_28C00303G0005 [uncultured bacterium]KKT76788.1 MAG: hypothetical protein UW70_C0013G0006 [Candidatus Peregrinibacteria bacterium GW2011_GWA2_44_7]